MSIRFILASNSPRRRELLSMLGMDFTVKVSDCDETVPEGTTPDEMVRELALRKARAVAESVTDDVCIIAADTVVADGTRILGKPKNEKDAFDTLISLSGHAHSVLTGVAVIKVEKGEIAVSAVDSVETKVVFGELTEDEVRFYVKTGIPLDKAGAYGIQDIGGFFVTELHGDYYNVVGLPIARLRTMLKDSFGLSPCDYIGQKELT